MSCLRLSFSIILVSLLSFSTIRAQTDFKGFVVGQITERASGQPIPNAKISVEGKAETISDADGKYILEIESSRITDNASVG